MFRVTLRSYSPVPWRTFGEFALKPRPARIAPNVSVPVLFFFLPGCVQELRSTIVAIGTTFSLAV